MTSIYYHEDDYCQIEILPLENFEFCLKQVGLVNEFADAHKDGIGYTDVYVRNENPIALYDKKYPVGLLENTLKGLLPKFDEVYSGYSSYREKCKYTNAFGNDENVVLFYDVNNDFVENIWLRLDIKNKNDIQLACNLFHILSKLGEFIIADWGWCFIETIDNFNMIDQYLQERLALFSAK